MSDLKFTLSDVSNIVSIEQSVRPQKKIIRPGLSHILVNLEKNSKINQLRNSEVLKGFNIAVQRYSGKQLLCMTLKWTPGVKDSSETYD